MSVDRQQESSPGHAPPSYSEQIVGGLAAGVIAVDSRGRVVSANPAAARHLDLDTGALREGTVLEEVEGLSPFVQILHEVRDSLKPIARREAFVGHGSSHRKEIGVSVSLLEGPEAFNGVIFLFTDMTERRRAERVADVNSQLAFLGRLAAGMVHELRNPLTIISGHTQLMKRKVEENEELRVSLESIVSETLLLDHAISQFLGFSKPFELRPVATSAKEILDRTFELCEERAKRKSVQFSRNVSEDFDALHVDKDRVAEALANIVGNAIDAVDSGGHVDVEAHQEDSESVFTISDDGPGIHLEEGEDLFSPFFTKKRDGTGLGLSIVQRVATAQGGSVTYGNRDGGGAYFEFRIPMIHGQADGDFLV